MRATEMGSGFHCLACGRGLLPASPILGQANLDGRILRRVTAALCHPERTMSAEEVLPSCPNWTPSFLGASASSGNKGTSATGGSCGMCDIVSVQGTPQKVRQR